MSEVRISVVSIVYNGKEHIADCMNSVITQTYDKMEYIIIDGGSTDGTMDIVNASGEQINRIISEKDNGIYDGLNKGIANSTGDVVGFLNSDDVYAHENVITHVAEVFNNTPETAAVYADLVYVMKNDLNKVSRYWKSGEFRPGRFKTGWMPPHPTFFVRKSVYEKFGAYDTSLKIAADYEMMVRLLYKNRLKTAYLPEVIIKMRQGGGKQPQFGDHVEKIIRRPFGMQKIPLGIMSVNATVKEHA